MPSDLSVLLDNQDSPVGVDNAHDGLLADLQANVLSSHGKAQAHYFFLRFRNPADAAKAKRVFALLACDRDERRQAEPNFGSEFPSFFSGPLRETHLVSELARVKGGHKAKGPVITVMVSRSGYKKIEKVGPNDPAFQVGMEARAAELKDPARQDWARGYREGEVHALVMVAFDEAVDGGEAVVSALGSLLEGTMAHQEVGFVRRQGKDPIEPSGFRDSISQPLFHNADLDRAAKLEGKAATVRGGKWRSFEPLRTVLVPDPDGTTPHACGSYAVFRKLRQNVAEFNAQVVALAKRLDRPADDVAADLFGRKRDGTPLAPSPNLNDFDYSGAGAGAAGCPLHAHVRKANRRDPAYRPHETRIVRRGLVYDQPASGGDAAETGLLFLCLQSSIVGQFETVQKWMNDTTGEGGADPIAGQTGTHNTIALQHANRPMAGRIHRFDQTVTLRGGEYFFVPSLSALKALL